MHGDSWEENINRLKGFLSILWRFQQMLYVCRLATPYVRVERKNTSKRKTLLIQEYTVSMLLSFVLSQSARKGEKSSLDFETVHEDWVKPGLPSSTLASVPRSFAAQCRDSRTGSGLVTLCSPVLDAFLSSSVSSFFPNSSFVKCFSNFYQIFCIQILQIFESLTPLFLISFALHFCRACLFV